MHSLFLSLSLEFKVYPKRIGLRELLFQTPEVWLHIYSLRLYGCPNVSEYQWNAVELVLI